MSPQLSNSIVEICLQYSLIVILMFAGTIVISPTSFLCFFIVVEWLLSKSFVFLSGSPFPGPLARERIMLVVGFFVCLFVCVLGCGVFCFGVCVVCILLVFPACCLLQFKVWDI